MSYRESKEAGLITIDITCDARKGRKDICGNEASITMQNRDVINQFIYNLGWRLLRGHQVCGECMAKGKVSLPRKAATR